MLTVDQAERLVAILGSAFPDANVTGHGPLIQVMTNQVKDRHVAAAAVYAHASLIVTANRRDFPAAALQPFEVLARSPDDFLCDLLEEGGATMAAVITEQAAALRRPPSTPESVLERLVRHAPTFAARLRAEFLSNTRDRPSD